MAHTGAVFVETRAPKGWKRTAQKTDVSLEIAEMGREMAELSRERDRGRARPELRKTHHRSGDLADAWERGSGGKRIAHGGLGHCV
eukprot:3696079-Rhodomonas_salina.1